MAMICLRQHSYPYCLTRARSAHAFMGQGVPKRLQARAGPESTLPACPGVSDASISRQPANLRERRPYGCRMGQSAEDLMGFAQGRLLSRAAILDGCLSVFEVEVLG